MAWEGSDRKHRFPHDWQQRRRVILKRDGVCQLQLAGCTTHPTEVDHRIAGDDHNLSNLQAVCTNCHRIKSSREGVEARKPRRRQTEPHPGRVT